MRGGIAAELITELLIADEPCLASVATDLHEMASSSAQALGLVDYLDIMSSDQRCPICVLEPLARDAVVAMTEAGMRRAERYVRVLREAGARRDVVAFAALPLAWAKSRLDKVQCEAGTDVMGPAAGVLNVQSQFGPS